MIVHEEGRQDQLHWRTATDDIGGPRVREELIEGL